MTKKTSTSNKQMEEKLQKMARKIKQKRVII